MTICSTDDCQTAWSWCQNPDDQEHTLVWNSRVPISVAFRVIGSQRLALYCGKLIQRNVTAHDVSFSTRPGRWIVRFANGPEAAMAAALEGAAARGRRKFDNIVREQHGPRVGRRFQYGAEQRFSVGMRRRGKNCGGRPDLADPPLVQDCDPIGERAYHGQIMRHEEIGRILLSPQRVEQIEYGCLHRNIERRRHFITQNQIRARREGARNGDTLLLAA